MFWFLIYNSFDATYLFEYTFILLYNLVFTSVPVGILGMFDQDTNAKASMAFPSLYKRGIAGLEYTRKRFWIYMTDGLYQSCIIFFIPFLAYGTGTTWSHDGMDTNSLWDFGTTIAAAGVVSANVYVGINTRYWTFITWIILGISILLCFIWIPIYSALAAPPYYGTVSVIYPTFSFWTIVIFTVFCAVGPRWLVSAFRQSYFPRDKDIIREAWVGGDLKAQLGIPHRRENRLAAPEEPPSFVQHVIKALGEEGDARGAYQPAAMASPQKSDRLLSGQSTPGTPFSYPPSPLRDRGDQLSPTLRYTPGVGGSVPPPLLARTPSDGGIARPPLARGSSSRERSIDGIAGPLGSDTLSPEYHHPSAPDQWGGSVRERTGGRSDQEQRRSYVDFSSPRNSDW